MAENQRRGHQSAGDTAGSEQMRARDGAWLGLFIQMTINGASVEAMVDTGSSHSFMARRVYESIDTSSRPPLRPLEGPMMMADGSPLAMYGRATIALQLGLLSYTMDIIVANIRHEGILGLDFLRGSRSVIDWYRHKLHTPCGIHECNPRLDEGPIWVQQDVGSENCWCFKCCK